jgi:hypothetical protein
MVGAGRHNQFWDGPAGSFEQITFIMKNTKQPNRAVKTVFSELPLG